MTESGFVSEVTPRLLADQRPSLTFSCHFGLFHKLPVWTGQDPAAGFLQSKWGGRRERKRESERVGGEERETEQVSKHQRQKPQSFYTLISEVTSHPAATRSEPQPQGTDPTGCEQGGESGHLRGCQHSDAEDDDEGTGGQPLHPGGRHEADGACELQACTCPGKRSTSGQALGSAVCLLLLGLGPSEML